MDEIIREGLSRNTRLMIARTNRILIVRAFFVDERNSATHESFCDTTEFWDGVINTQKLGYLGIIGLLGLLGLSDPPLFALFSLFGLFSTNKGRPFPRSPIRPNKNI